jgi:hypothetical protein
MVGARFISRLDFLEIATCGAGGSWYHCVGQVALYTWKRPPWS